MIGDHIRFPHLASVFLGRVEALAKGEIIRMGPDVVHPAMSRPAVLGPDFRFELRLLTIAMLPAPL